MHVMIFLKQKVMENAETIYLYRNTKLDYDLSTKSSVNRNVLYL